MPTRTHKAIACKYISKISTRLSKNGMDPWVLLPRILLCLETLRPRDINDSESVRQCVLVFAHDRYSHAGNCIGFLANTGLFLSTGDWYLFLLQSRLIPFDSSSVLLISILSCLASKFRKRSFWSVLLFTMVSNFWQLEIDIFWWISMSYKSNVVSSCANSRILNVCRLTNTSTDGIFDMDNRTSTHLVSNSWTLSSWRAEGE